MTSESDGEGAVTDPAPPALPTEPGDADTADIPAVPPAATQPASFAADPYDAARRTAPRTGPRWVAIVMAVLLAGALSVAGLYVAGVLDLATPTPRATAAGPATTSPPVPTTDPLDAAIEEALPSIVWVEAHPDLGQAPAATATGYLARPGHVVVPHHVVEGAAAVTVVLDDGVRHTATVVGTDRLTNVAVLAIDTATAPLEAGTAGGGRDVRAVARSGDLEAQVTPAGIVAEGIRLDLDDGRRLYGLTEVDTALAAGAVLIDESGHVIGIATGLGGDAAASVIPVTLIQSVIDDLIGLGEVPYAYLGMQTETHLALDAEGRLEPIGAEIFSFSVDSAIERTGVRIGDVVVAIDGRPVTTAEELVAAVRSRRAGEAATIVVVRDGLEITVTMTYDRHPDS